MKQSGLSREPSDPGLSRAGAENLAARFKLLSDPGRLQIVYALLESGELRVGEIAETVGASESATSHQLHQLRLARPGGATRGGPQGRSRGAPQPLPRAP